MFHKNSLKILFLAFKPATSFSIDKIAKPFIHSFVIVDLGYVLISFNLLILHSQAETVTEIVSNIFEDIHKFDIIVYWSLIFIKLRISKGLLTFSGIRFLRDIISLINSVLSSDFLVF